MQFRRMAKIPIGYLDSPLKQIVSAGHGDGYSTIEVEGVLNSFVLSMAETILRNSSIFFAQGTDLLVSTDMGRSMLRFRYLDDGGIEIYRSC